MKAYLSTLRCYGDVDFWETVSLGAARSQIEQKPILTNAEGGYNEARSAQV